MLFNFFSLWIQINVSKEMGPPYLKAVIYADKLKRAFAFMPFVSFPEELTSHCWNPEYWRDAVSLGQGGCLFYGLMKTLLNKEKFQYLFTSTDFQPHFQTVTIFCAIKSHFESP